MFLVIRNIDDILIMMFRYHWLLGGRQWWWFSGILVICISTVPGSLQRRVLWYHVLWYHVLLYSVLWYHVLWYRVMCSLRRHWRSTIAVFVANIKRC